MHFWPKKPDPVIEWKLRKALEEVCPPPGKWFLFCKECQWEYPVTIAELSTRLHLSCPACEYVNGLPASSQDFYLTMLEYDLEVE